MTEESGFPVEYL